MCAESSEVVRAELLCILSIGGWKSVLVRILPAEIGDAAGLGWVQIELEPLMSGTEIIDLEAPVALIAFVSKLATFYVSRLSC